MVTIVEGDQNAPFSVATTQSGRIDTAIWMHYLDANKTAEEEARRQLHKNAASNIEQVMEVTPDKAPSIRPHVLLGTPAYGRTKAGRPVRTYIQQLCEDIGCWPEDLPETMNDREEWHERVRDIRAGGMT